MKQLKRAVTLAVATLAVASAAYAAIAQFGGFLNPGAAQNHITNLPAGQRLEVDLKGNHDDSEWRMRVYQKNGASWVLIRDKVSDDEEMQMKFVPAVATQYLFQVRNTSTHASAYEVKIKQD